MSTSQGWLVRFAKRDFGAAEDCCRCAEKSANPEIRIGLHSFTNSNPDVGGSIALKALWGVKKKVSFVILMNWWEANANQY